MLTIGIPPFRLRSTGVQYAWLRSWHTHLPELTGCRSGKRAGAAIRRRSRRASLSTLWTTRPGWLKSSGPKNTTSFWWMPAMPTTWNGRTLSVPSPAQWCCPSFYQSGKPRPRKPKRSFTAFSRRQSPPCPLPLGHRSGHGVQAEHAFANGAALVGGKGGPRGDLAG